MAVDKNFVVKNGIEVNSNLIIANANTKKVGIGSTNPRVTLDVRGGIAATDGHFTGVLTCSTLRGIENYGVLNGTGANVSGFSTFASGVSIEHLTVTGFTTIADIALDEVNARNLNLTGIATAPTFVGLTEFDKISVSGISTITSLDSTNASISGITTATNRILVKSDDSTPGRIDYFCEVSNAHYTRVQSAPHAEYSGNVTAILPTISGDILVGDTATNISQSVRTSGIVTASAFYGDGANITGISTLNIINYTGGTGVGDTDISINTTGIITAAAFFTSGIITASTFSGDGSQLTGLGVGINTETGLVGYGFTQLDFRGSGVTTANYNTNLGIATFFIESGEGIADLVEDLTPQLGGNLDLNGNNITGTGDIPAANLTGTLPTISGANLTNLNGSNIASGTVDAARIPTLNQDTTGNAATATEATNVTVTANNSTDETVYPVFVDGATGTQGAETDTGLNYNPSTGNLTATKFTGDGSALTDVTVSSATLAVGSRSGSVNVSVSAGTITVIGRSSNTTVTVDF